MAEPFGFGKVVSCAPHCGKLQSLGALIVEEGNLLVICATCPTASHNIGNGSNIRVVDLVKRRRGDFLLFVARAGNVSEHAITSTGNTRGTTVCEESRR